MITETDKVPPPSPAPNQGSSQLSLSICASSLRIPAVLWGREEAGKRGMMHQKMGCLQDSPGRLRDCQGPWWRGIWASGRRRGMIRKGTDHQAGLLFAAYCGFWNTTHCLSLPEKAMAPHSSTLAWKIPQMEEPGWLQSTGSLRVGHNWATSLSLFTFMHWRRKWQPTPVFLPAESQGQRSLVGCRLWGRTELDTTEVT